MKLATRLDKLGTETAFAVSGAAKQWAAKGHRVYPFHLGDINLPTPQIIVEATDRAIADGYTGYCPGAGIPELREAIAEDVSAKRHVTYSMENVSVQPGGKPVISKFLAATMNPGDEVLYPNPGFPIYESQIEFQDGIAVPYGFTPTDTGFALDMDAIRRSISDRTTVLIYNNYHNPTSAQSSREEMEELAEIALANDLWVLTDDAYLDTIYGDKPLSIVNLPGMQERSVILWTCSKRYAMTGWRLGAAIGPTEIIDVINTMNTNIESCTNHFVQKAMSEVIPDERGAVLAIVDELRRRRDAAVAGLNAIDGISVPTPECTFYLFPNVSEIIERKGYRNVNQLMDESLWNTDVSFCTRRHFGRPIPGEDDAYIRLAYSGIDVPSIQEGLARLKEFFEA